jgi:hypothetical protein
VKPIEQRTFKPAAGDRRGATRRTPCRRTTGLALFCLALAGAAAAEDEWLTRVTPNETALSGFVSKHFGYSRKFNEINYGAGYRWSEGFMAGYYRNSLDRNGFYVGREFQWRLSGPFNVGLVVGGVTGYAWAVTPMVLPELVVKFKPVEFAFSVIPPIPNVTPAAVVVQARYLFF